MKLIKLEDAIEQVKTEFYGGGYQEWLEISIDNLINRIANLPTIEFSEDCIGREYMKSLGYINKGDFNSVETIREWIDNAPSVIPKAKGGEWIPCSERLPEDGVAVLTTTENEEVYIDQVITGPSR